MNRLSTENVQYFITPTMEFQTQEPFVLYKSANSESLPNKPHTIRTYHRM
jgi:hypothetical protein